MTFKSPPLTLAQAKEIARSVHAIRRDWDKPGIEDALGRARHLGDPASVAIAAHRAAAEPGNRTPAVIALDGPHWRAASRPAPRFPAPAAGERCSICSERESICRERWSRDHAFRPDLRPDHGDAAEHVDSLRELRESRVAELCRHHVPLTNCTECPPPAAEEPTTTEETPDA